MAGFFGEGRMGSGGGGRGWQGDDVESSMRSALRVNSPSLGVVGTTASLSELLATERVARDRRR